MKKLGILCCLLAMTFSSCSDDDNKSNISLDLLLKKWYYVSYEFEGETFPYEHEFCARDYIEIQSAGVAKDVLVEFCTDPISYDIATGTWTLNGNKFTVTFNELELYVITGTITNLTTTTLRIKAQEDFDDDGTMETYYVNFTSI